MGKLTCSFAWLALSVGAVACNGGPDYPINPGDDDPEDPDASPDDPDADPNAPDADEGPDALGDGAAPVITLLEPAAGSLVSGVMRLAVDVLDDDGVDQVTATIAAVPITMTQVAGSTSWQGTFDTEALAGLVAPTIVVRATDEAGAQRDLGFQVILDNRPPVASLDPPIVREGQIDQGTLQCSHEFDPVGPDAPNDGEAVAQLVELRARIVDLPNTGTVNSTIYIPYAGIRDAELYVLDDTARPLIVDTDGDGTCDAINPDIEPAIVPMASNEAALIALGAIDPAGSADFTPEMTFGGDNATACAPGDDQEPPEPVCFGELGMARLIATTFAGEPQIYGIPPASELNCAGFAFDALASNISDGWACAAVATADHLGNGNVSPVLRLCVDSDGDQAECAAWGSIAPANARPDCTGTVTGGVVTTTPCTIPAPFYVGDDPDEYEIVMRF